MGLELALIMGLFPIFMAYPKCFKSKGFGSTPLIFLHGVAFINAPKS